MRIVFDTNVFISGVFFSGPPYEILKAWRDGKVQLVISQQILEEYQRVGETLAEFIQSKPYLADNRFSRARSGHGAQEDGLLAKRQWGEPIFALL